jgi:chromosome segregation ATPase
MTKDEFMRRADDAIYMNNLSLLQGEVDALFGELDRLRARASEDADRLHKAVAEVERLRAERDEARMVIRGLESKIADYERRSEANAEIANEAQAAAAREREVANEHVAQRHDAERERDEARAEIAAMKRSWCEACAKDAASATRRGPRSSGYGRLCAPALRDGETHDTLGRSDLSDKSSQTTLPERCQTVKKGS